MHRCKVSTAAESRCTRRMTLPAFIYLLLATRGGALSPPGLIGRREQLMGFAASNLLFIPQTNAFENAVPDAAKYRDRPKRSGNAPKDIGLRLRDEIDSDFPELKVCGGAPNCFSTTPDDIAPEHFVAPWRAPKGTSAAEAWNTLYDTVRAYEPGQSDIDGGGFQIIEANSEKKYIYVVFESLKNGYRDDLEFALDDSLDPPLLRLRSSSRVGYLDFGVNAKRLNFFAANLRAKQWTAPEITAQTHPSYFIQNAPRSDQVAPSTAFRR